MSEGPPSPKRLRLDFEDLGSCSKEELIDKLRELNDHVTYLQSKQRGSLDKDEGDDKDGDDKLKQPNPDASRRENTLVLRLTNKEQELQDCMNQIAEMKASQTQNSAQLRSLLLDPAVNLVFQRMAKEMEDLKEKYKQTQNELSAWKFTADSQMGKRLMAKCRMLFQENEELGKMLSSGRTSKLEAEIALQKTLVTEMKTNQDEMNEFVSELEEDVEGMQSMIYVLQQQLKDTKEHVAALEAENARLRTLQQQLQQQQAAAAPVKQEPNDDSSVGVNSVTAADSSMSGGDGAGPCGGEGCVSEAASTSGEVTGGTETAAARPWTKGPATSPGGAQAGSPLSSLTVSTGQLSPKVETSTNQLLGSPNVAKRTAGSEETDGAGLLAKGRTTATSGAEVVGNNQHECSLAAADTSDLRTDQACDSMPLVAPKVVQLAKDVAAKGDCKMDIKITAAMDVNPVRNGILEPVTNPSGESEN